MSKQTKLARARNQLSKELHVACMAHPKAQRGIFTRAYMADVQAAQNRFNSVFASCAF